MSKTRSSKTALRGNYDRAHARKIRIAIFLLLIAAAAVAALGIGCLKLKALYNDQCRLPDDPSLFAQEVHVSSTGPDLPRNFVVDMLGIRPGINLASLDFATLREHFLATNHNIEELSITRRLPSGLDIDVKVREPVAQMNYKGAKSPSYRVVDTHGKVFNGGHSSLTLPIIREPRTSATPAGGNLSEYTRAALRLVEAAQETDFRLLNLKEIETSSAGYLVATLGEYAQAKIAWDGMLEDTPASCAAMRRQLAHLTAAVKTGLGAKATVWNATERDRVFADTKEIIP